MASSCSSVFADAGMTWSATADGTGVTVQLASDNEELRSDSSTFWHSSHWPTCDETNSARSAARSPSTKAMTSSGATGCVVVFMRGPLSVPWAARQFEKCLRVPLLELPWMQPRTKVRAGRAAPCGRGKGASAQCSQAIREGQQPTGQPRSRLAWRDRRWNSDGRRR